MPSFDRYMAQYDHEHTNAWNKILHGVGIPLIIAGIVLALLTFWRTGLALFVAGWILLLAGHRIEGNKPAFFQGLIYFLVGPIWIAKEIKDALRSSSRSSTPSRISDCGRRIATNLKLPFRTTLHRAAPPQRRVLP